ncbi:MAG: putative transcriptional regulator [Candidatus Acidoferrum typicum]|nr:putative transcriptional regulator [Candidatus Acidoferrum typicum]
MFSIPIEEITFDDVNSFCQARPREGLVLDYKLDFPRRLDKTIAAFANTYGGHVLIGVDETQTGEPVLPIAGVALQPGLRERVVATALDAIYPPVYPAVRVVEFQSPGATTPDRAVVIVRIQESDASAHAVDGGKSVYLRVDNISDQFLRQATVEEIEWLTNKRKKSLALKDSLLAAARNRATNYLVNYRAMRRLSTQEPRGRYIMWTVPTFPRSELARPERLLELSRTWRVQVAGYEFPNGLAVPIVDGIRQPQAPVMNYWYTEVNRFGLVYTEIGYTGQGDEYSEVIVCSLVASLIVASLRFSTNLYMSLGYFGLVDFRFDVSPTLNRYPYLAGLISGPHLTDARTLENSISLGFTEPVRELGESLMQRARRTYREFLWAFGLNVDDVTASSHFSSFSIQ